jgi:hypothetical protein
MPTASKEIMLAPGSHYAPRFHLISRTERPASYSRNGRRSVFKGFSDTSRWHEISARNISARRRKNRSASRQGLCAEPKAKLEENRIKVLDTRVSARALSAKEFLKATWFN